MQIIFFQNFSTFTGLFQALLNNRRKIPQLLTVEDMLSKICRHYTIQHHFKIR